MDARRVGGILALVAVVGLLAIGAVWLLRIAPGGSSATSSPSAQSAATITPSPAASALTTLPVSPSPSPSPSPTAPQTATPSATQDAETQIRAFYTVFVAAVRSGDVETLLALLHPATIQRYSTADCRTTIVNLIDPAYAVVVKTVHPQAPWDYARDGLTTTVADAWAVDVDLTTRDGTAALQFHVAPVDGEIRWFADCGTPSKASPAP